MEGILEERVKGFIEGRGYVVFDIRWLRFRENRQLRVYVDHKDGGITMEECAVLNGQISDFLDKEVDINFPYVLEVSSPGMDWPLRTPRDWQRVKTRRVRVHFSDGTSCEGRVEDVREEGVRLSCRGRDVFLGFGSIVSAKEVWE